VNVTDNNTRGRDLEKCWLALENGLDKMEKTRENFGAEWRKSKRLVGGIENWRVVGETMKI
jgi:hypothetical protein